MLRLRSNTPRWVIIVIDQFIALFSLAFAYLIRFDLKADKELIRTEWAILSKSILIYFIVKLVVFYVFKIHKGLVRHTSTADLRRIFLASLTTSIIYWVLGFIRFYQFDGYYLFPTSVLVMEFLVCFMVMIGSRFFVKALFLETIKNKGEEERILIYGAGISGLITKRTIEKDARINYAIVGFVDDNQKMNGTRLEGVPVFVTDPVRSQCRDIANTDLSQIETPSMPDRTAWLQRISQFHWSHADLVSGRCWAHMRQWV
jgi:FlaA1/EpsC-like NDP-sugar epimerase